MKSPHTKEAPEIADLESRLRAAESRKRRAKEALPSAMQLAALPDMQLATLLAETLVEILRRRRG